MTKKKKRRGPDWDT